MLPFIALSCSKEEETKDKETPRTNLTVASSYKHGEIICVNEGVVDNVGLKSVEFTLKYLGEGEGWEPSETVLVDGKYYDFDNVNIFGESIPYDAAVGDYQLIVNVCDLVDNVFTKRYEISIASTDTPVVSLLAPEENAILSMGEQLLITANYSDDVGLKSASYTIRYNGTENNPWSPPVQNIPIEGPEVSIVNENIFEEEIPLTVAAGEYELVVCLTDIDENTQTITRAFDVVLKDVHTPTISLLSPATNQTYKWSERVFVSGTLTDNISLKSASYSLDYNGVEDNPWEPAEKVIELTGKTHELSNLDIFEADIPNGVAEGSYSLKVMVINGSGKTSTKTVNINIDKGDHENPTMNIVTPNSTSCYYPGDRILITGTYADNNGLSSVHYFIKHSSVTEGFRTSSTKDLSGTSVSIDNEDVFDKEIPESVEPGIYNLFFTIVDECDNSIIEKISISIAEKDS